MEITLAVDRYDRHFPFFDGSLSHDFDLDIKPLQVGQSAQLQHGTDRHESFLRGQYDVAEFFNVVFSGGENQRLSHRGDTSFSETFIQY